MKIPQYQETLWREEGNHNPRSVTNIEDIVAVSSLLQEVYVQVTMSPSHQCQ